MVHVVDDKGETLLFFSEGIFPNLGDAIIKLLSNQDNDSMTIEEINKYF